MGEVVGRRGVREEGERMREKIKGKNGRGLGEVREERKGGEEI